MNKTTITKSSFPFKAVILTAIVCFALSGGAAYLFGLFRQHGTVKTAPEISGNLLGDKAEASLYTCGMHPWILSEEPGNCPICGMKLTPKRDEGGETGTGTVGGVEINIDPVIQQNMGIRTATAEKSPMIHTIRTYGHITYDETRTAEISPKYNGWFEKLYVDFTGQIVQKDQPLFEIYSPELLAAQEEYLIAFRSGSRSDMLESAQRRLSYFDVGEEEIRAISASDTVKKTLTIRSPFTGVVTHKNAVKGGFVKAGTSIYKIADISRVWVEAHIYEYELGRISQGQNAEMTLPYLPGKVYSGKVAYIYPYLQQKTRDVVIRLEFENPSMELKPDMYADVRIETIAKDQGILIPSEAVIRSGERNVVFVTREENKFAPREITLGMSVDKGKIQILAGLEPGETIVTSGQFLLDSESKLKEAVQKMMEAKKGGSEEDDFFEDFEDMENEQQF
ncbi:MAG: efflux RND transporter periplasmic adaptor subunit [Desulfobacterales bacterium]|nr:efflux RND transporter periplasmic adaptor subunit [Desulfobacterales bacterium]